MSLGKHDLPDSPAREAYERTLRSVPVTEEDHRLTDEIARAEAVVDTLGSL